LRRTHRWVAKYGIGVATFMSLCVNVQAQAGPMQRTVTSFNVTGVSRIDAILMLAQRQRIPLGIEYAGMQLFEPISVRLSQTDVQGAASAIFPLDAGFRISSDDGVLVISHRKVPAAPLNVLDTRLANFSIPKCSLQEAYIRLANQLLAQLTPPPGRRGITGSIPGAGSVQIGPFTMSDVTVREVLNRIVREHGNAAWIVQVEPQVLSLPSGTDLEKKVADGSLIAWTVVEYSNRVVMEKIGQMTKTHVVSVESGTH